MASILSEIRSKRRWKGARSQAPPQSKQISIALRTRRKLELSSSGCVQVRKILLAIDWENLFRRYQTRRPGLDSSSRPVQSICRSCGLCTKIRYYDLGNANRKWIVMGWMTMTDTKHIRYISTFSWRFGHFPVSGCWKFSSDNPGQMPLCNLFCLMIFTTLLKPFLVYKEVKIERLLTYN